MVLVWIRSPWILSGNIFIDSTHAADVCWGHPGKSQLRSRWRLPKGQSHDELPSLLVSVVLLLLVGRCQERRWGTFAFLALSILTMAILPLLYTLVLFVGGGEASRICGYSAIQLALFTAQCRQVSQRRLLRCLPVWFLPWLLLLIGLLLLPGTPALLHFCTIFIGHNYHQPFIGMLQELEEARVLDLIPHWAFVPTSARFRLPIYTTSQRSRSLSQKMPVDQADAPPMRDPSVFNHHPWVDPMPAWIMKESAVQSEAEVLDEQMLRAGILASLQDAADDPDAKVEVPKSSVSSLRLQQLEKMGFPTEKAVVALAASKQLDGAISLLIDDSVGEEAVVVSKGKSPLPPQST
ncbi:rhomboid domain-containing protein 3 isoform X2 [Siniperca chuatsi]|uniref:rhomboid domain-containing protein 3 isoform X2 n=1 Tax=Siniperca chuatsi TaxID=119488 RepID=UPI001CE07615|nr:rhomboid domain-containing protein 3 isoform X2 [Siniperca chuatsi]XP_044053545.1 rhomboid domain-containing protein 3 isoform X2 [Siniperca chuatsi]